MSGWLVFIQVDGLLPSRTLQVEQYDYCFPFCGRKISLFQERSHTASVTQYYSVLAFQAFILPSEHYFLLKFITYLFIKSVLVSTPHLFLPFVSFLYSVRKSMQVIPVNAWPGCYCKERGREAAAFRSRVLKIDHPCLAVATARQGINSSDNSEFRPLPLDQHYIAFII